MIFIVYLKKIKLKHRWFVCKHLIQIFIIYERQLNYTPNCLFDFVNIFMAVFKVVDVDV